jgi:hypothetical protein
MEPHGHASTNKISLCLITLAGKIAGKVAGFTDPDRDDKDKKSGSCQPIPLVIRAHFAALLTIKVRPEDLPPKKHSPSGLKFCYIKLQCFGTVLELSLQGPFSFCARLDGACASKDDGNG